MIILPRQARDKRSEISEKKDLTCFLPRPLPQWRDQALQRLDVELQELHQEFTLRQFQRPADELLGRDRRDPDPCLRAHCSRGPGQDPRLPRRYLRRRNPPHEFQFHFPGSPCVCCLNDYWNCGGGANDAERIGTREPERRCPEPVLAQ